MRQKNDVTENWLIFSIWEPVFIVRLRHGERIRRFWHSEAPMPAGPGQQALSGGSKARQLASHPSPHPGLSEPRWPT